MEIDRETGFLKETGVLTEPRLIAAEHSRLALAKAAVQALAAAFHGHECRLAAVGTEFRLLAGHCDGQR